MWALMGMDSFGNICVVMGGLWHEWARVSRRVPWLWKGWAWVGGNGWAWVGGQGWSGKGDKDRRRLD